MDIIKQSPIMLHSKCDYLDGDTTAPRTEVWEWFRKNTDANVHIFEDHYIMDHLSIKCEVRVAFLLESPTIYQVANPNANPYDYIEHHHAEFDYIMSSMMYLKDLVGEDKFIYCPVGGSRIKRNQFGLYEKERLVSIVASHKKWTHGHQLRHQIIKRYKPQIETYGSGYNNIINEHNASGKIGKVIAIGPYYFSFAIMNSKHDDYFTEIVNDCVAVGTIPIWWGTPNIGKYFNPDGIIQFNDISDLDAIMGELSPEFYQSKISAVKENVELSKKYITHYDFVYDNYKQFFENL